MHSYKEHRSLFGFTEGAGSIPLIHLIPVLHLLPFAERTRSKYVT